MKEVVSKVRNNKGITLITLAVAISVLLIVTGTLIYKANDIIDIKKLRNMYDDIEFLDDKVDTYYMETGIIPKVYEYNNVDSIENKNPADGNNYYVIDLDSLDGITTLNYGRGFSRIDGNNSTETDVYIINEKTHQIYYVRGIESDGVKYYTNEIKNIIDVKGIYIIKYDANGGSGYIEDDVVIEGRKITLDSGLSFKRDDYFLDSWNTEQDGSGTKYELGDTLHQKDENGNNLITGNITLYAIWEEK